MAFCQHKNLQRLAGAHATKKYRCLDCGVIITGGVAGKNLYEPFDNSYLQKKKEEKLKQDRKFW